MSSSRLYDRLLVEGKSFWKYDLRRHVNLRLVVYGTEVSITHENQTRYERQR
jgi:hypothetical protein